MTCRITRLAFSSLSRWLSVSWSCFAIQRWMWFSKADVAFTKYFVVSSEIETSAKNKARNRIVFVDVRYCLISSGVYGVSSDCDNMTIAPHPSTISKNATESYFQTIFSPRYLIASTLLNTIDKHDVVESNTRLQYGSVSKWMTPPTMPHARPNCQVRLKYTDIGFVSLSSSSWWWASFISR